MFSKACDFFVIHLQMSGETTVSQILYNLFNPEQTLLWPEQADMHSSLNFQKMIHLTQAPPSTCLTPIAGFNSGAMSICLKHSWTLLRRFYLSFRKTSCICNGTFCYKSHYCELLQIAVYFLLSVSWYLSVYTFLSKRYGGCGPKLGIFPPNPNG